MNKKTTQLPVKAYHPHYADKKPFFSDKEIIFRSGGRAKVFNISSRFQVIFLIVVAAVAFWSTYFYHMYNKSGAVILKKNEQIVATRDAYVELVSDFAALHKNIEEWMKDKKIKPSKELEQQSSVVEDKIKVVTEEKEWVSAEQLKEKVSLTEALLQRDIVISERDELRAQIDEMQQTLADMKNAEAEVFSKVDQMVSKEVNKIKGVFNSINATLQKKNLYFNALAIGRKNLSQGGAYTPAKGMMLNDKKLDDKISKIFNNINDLNYYKEVVQYVPIGKPVWSYWVTSQFGARTDPFNGGVAKHKGIDLASMTGNKIKVKAKGKVTRSEYSPSYGNLVVIDHGNGFETRYGHLNKIYVKEGDYLEYDDIVGEVGSTGRSTGPHLHYEILYMGHNVNPLTFIKAKAS